METGAVRVAQNMLRHRVNVDCGTEDYERRNGMFLFKATYRPCVWVKRTKKGAKPLHGNKVFRQVCVVLRSFVITFDLGTSSRQESGEIMAVTLINAVGNHIKPPLEAVNSAKNLMCDYGGNYGDVADIAGRAFSIQRIEAENRRNKPPRNGKHQEMRNLKKAMDGVFSPGEVSPKAVVMEFGGNALFFGTNLKRDSVSVCRPSVRRPR